jgi:hypothetical protein
VQHRFCTLIYSTYFGGTGAVEGAGNVVVDAQGNVYIAGGTSASDFPTTPNAFITTYDGGYCSNLGYNCFESYVAKFDPTGSTLLYSTYLGGAGGGTDGTLGYSAPKGLAVDSLGQAFITGTTTSSTLPTTVGAYKPKCILNTLQTECASGQVFVTVLNSTGSALIYSTYLGGTGNDQGYGIAVDSTGSAVVTGTAGSADFPLANPLQSQPAGGFFTKLTPDGSGLVFSSYLGPPIPSPQILVNAVALDPAGNLYIAGSLQTTRDGYLGFLDKIDKSGGSLIYSASLTGSSTTSIFGPFTQILALTVDSLGQAYVTGETNVSGFPQVNSILPNFVGGTCPDPEPSICNHGFVSEFNVAGNALLFSTYLGGNYTDSGVAIAIDQSQSIYVTGETNSTDFPIANAFQKSYGGGGTCLNNQPCYDAFVTKLEPPLQIATPTTLSFLPQLVNTTSASQAVIVANSSLQPAQIQSLGVSANFSETDNCAGSIAAGGTCTVNVSSSPLVTGPLTGNLSISFSGSTTPLLVALSGTGTQATSPTISPASLQFAAQAIGSPSAAQSVTVTAQGTGALNISNIAASGDFSETNNCGASVAVGSSCSISVIFNPQAPGARTGQITINDNAGNSPQMISLSGTGTGPFAVLSLSSLQFSPELFDTISPPQPVTLTNTGSSQLNITAINVSADFGETNNCGTSLAPAASCSLSVTFSPTGLGARSGSIAIMDNSLGSPQTIQLAGTGIFSIGPGSGSPASATVTAGQTATYQLSLGPNGFSASVVLTCAPVAAIPNANCFVSPNPVSVSGTNAPAVTASVTTTSRSGLLLPTRIWPFGDPSVKEPRVRRWLFYFLVSLLMVMASLKFRRAPRALAAALLMGVLIAGCAGGSTSGSGGGPTGTPAGTYHLLITASSSGVSATTTLTLIVQ